MVQFALWFGTTWVVNALVFAGILVSVLAAVAVTKRVNLRRPLVLYGFLFGALAVSWAIPPDALLELSVPVRWIAATVLTFAPVFIANLVFAQRFARTASATAAFGQTFSAPCLEASLSMRLIVGYRALILVAGFIYAAAFLLRPKEALGSVN